MLFLTFYFFNFRNITITSSNNRYILPASSYSIKRTMSITWSALLLPSHAPPDAAPSLDQHLCTSDCPKFFLTLWRAANYGSIISPGDHLSHGQCIKNHSKLISANQTGCILLWGYLLFCDTLLWLSPTAAREYWMPLSTFRYRAEIYEKAKLL